MKYKKMFTETIFWGVVYFFAGCAPQKNHPLVRFGGLTQGTTYQIMYVDSLRRDYHDDVDSILRVIDFSLSLYNPRSTLSRVNRNETDSIHDPHFLRVFALSEQISQKTGGAFDPTVGALVSLWGFGLKKKEPISSERIDSIRAFTGMDKVRLAGNRLIKTDRRVQLDFNAIAQGYTVDVLGEYLESRGIVHYLIEVGGEVRARGCKPDGQLWAVGIEKPVSGSEDQRKIQEVLMLQNRSLATSGNYRKFIEENGVRYGHTIDPSTGYPARNRLLSVTVMAEDCTTADALATAFMVMGMERAKEFLAQHSAYDAYFISSDSVQTFSISMTDNFRKAVQRSLEYKQLGF